MPPVGRFLLFVKGKWSDNVDTFQQLQLNWVHEVTANC